MGDEEVLKGASSFTALLGKIKTSSENQEGEFLWLALPQVPNSVINELLKPLMLPSSHCSGYSSPKNWEASWIEPTHSPE